MCFDFDAVQGGKFYGMDATKEFDKAWGGGRWMDRIGIGKENFDTSASDKDDDYTEDVTDDEITDSTSDTDKDEGDIGYGGSGIDKLSAATLKRKRGTGRGMRSKMRKDLKIKKTSGRNPIFIPGIPPPPQGRKS